MLRPLPPFRAKPLRTIVVRKTIDAERIREITSEMLSDPSPTASPLRVGKPGDASRLKVLCRPASNT
jgi:hypothetical protein